MIEASPAATGVASPTVSRCATSTATDPLAASRHIASTAVGTPLVRSVIPVGQAWLRDSDLARGLVAPGIGLLFLALVAIVASFFAMGETNAVIIVAAGASGRRGLLHGQVLHRTVRRLGDLGPDDLFARLT